MTRRGMLGGAAMLGAGAGLDRVLGGVVAGTGGRQVGSSGLGETVPFYGAHQAGIATAAQEYLCFAAFDMTGDTVDELRGLMRDWTLAAAALTAGEAVEPGSQPADRPPVETGEAVGLGASRLTLTFGFGPGLFGVDAPDRFGLGRRRPAGLAPLPAFRGESLQPARSGGEVCVQACANDPQVAFHAVHALSRLADGVAVLRWMQLGFGRTSSTSRAQSTPRNLMGFKDGTANLRSQEAQAMERYVWVQPADGPRWMDGGSYLIARRIKILFDVWDATSLEGQQRVIGREKLSGAPLGERNEYAPIDLNAVRDGEPVIPADAHVRLASPQYNGAQRILRRGYSYSEGTEAGTGTLEAGLFFIAFQRAPSQFIEIQRRLAAGDALNRHTLHTASAIFACPPGARSGGYVGQELLS